MLHNMCLTHDKILPRGVGEMTSFMIFANFTESFKNLKGSVFACIDFFLR